MENKRTIAISLAGLGQTSKVDELLYFQELERRELYLNDQVDDEVIDTLVKHILRWNVEDEGKSVEERTPIKLHVNTYGGDLYACFSVVSAIRSSKTPVYTVNLGKAISAGSLIFLSGHKRLSYRNSFILIHEGESGYVNQTSKTKDHYKFTEKCEKRVKELVLSTTTVDSDLYDTNYQREWYIFGDEAVEFGMVDELID